MSGKLRNWECLAVLRSVSAGTRTVTADAAPAAVFAGNVTYTTGDGWTIVVFNDCNSWDYVEAMRAPDGRRRAFTGRDPPFDWRPDARAIVERWGWPAAATVTGFRAAALDLAAALWGAVTASARNAGGR